MKNKGLIVTSIILLLLLIAVLIGFLIICLNGNLNYSGKFISMGRKSSNVILDKNYEFNEIKNIEIKAECGDITFEKNLEDNIRVVAYGQNNNDIKIDINDDKLKIDYTEYDRPWFNFGTYKNDIIVYIPETYDGKIDIKNEYGNCKLNDLEKSIIQIDCDCGNIDLGKVKDIKVKCDYGNTKIESVLNKCEIKADCGNVKIKRIAIKEDSSIKSDYGNVDIEEVNDIYVDAKADLGNVNINCDNNRNTNITLNINSDCGNINVK